MLTGLAGTFGIAAIGTENVQISERRAVLCRVFLVTCVLASGAALDVILY